MKQRMKYLKQTTAMAALTGAVFIAAFAIAGGTRVDAQGAPVSATAPITPVPNAPASFADLVEQVSPAVVSVNVRSRVGNNLSFGFPSDEEGGESPLDQFRDLLPEGLIPRGEGPRNAEPREGRSLGSGFFVRADGYIVTNHHVVEGAEQIEVVLQDGDRLSAEIVGSDVATDLAVLKVDGTGFDYVEFNTSRDYRVGDWVVALGNPFGLGHTATSGIISAVGRSVGGPYADFIQTDAAINRGNSGGPTFDMQGRVVGVNTQIISQSGGSVGVGFAIQGDVAKRYTDLLIKYGEIERGYLGVSISSIDADGAASFGLDEPMGALVAEVTADGPADDGGVRVGDLIVSINGEDVEDSSDLTRKVADLIVGDEARLEVLRDNRKRTLRVTIARRPASLDDPRGALRPGAPDSEADEPQMHSEMGIAVRTAREAELAALELSEDGGVILTRVEPFTSASQKGLRRGDVITQVNGQIVTDASTFEAAIEAARDDGLTAVRLYVHTRIGGATQARFVALSID